MTVRLTPDGRKSSHRVSVTSLPPNKSRNISTQRSMIWAVRRRVNSPFITERDQATDM